MKLSGKIAVVTGGASGIGEFTARAMVNEGAKVVIADMNDQLGNKVVEELNGNAIFIRVNAVCPGYIDTPLLNQLDDDMKNHLISLHPIGRLGRADEIAKPIVFLASDDASFVTGANLLVDGGYTAQ